MDDSAILPEVNSLFYVYISVSSTGMIQQFYGKLINYSMLIYQHDTTFCHIKFDYFDQ